MDAPHRRWLSVRRKKLDGNCARMLWAILNKSWRSIPQNSSRTATYHPSWKSSKLDEEDKRDTAGELISGVHLLTSSHGCTKFGRTAIYSSSVQKQDVAWKTRWSDGQPRLEPCWSILLIGSFGAMWAWWGKQFHEPKCGSGHVCQFTA